MRRGFTLIELLVVVAIIALLSALLLSSIAIVRAQAKSTVCASSMRQIGLAFGAYANDNGGAFPPAYATSNFIDTPYSRWFGALVGFLEEDGTVSGGKISAPKVFVCPESNHATRSLDAYGLSYGYNADAGYPANTWQPLLPQRFQPGASRIFLAERWAINVGGSADWDWAVTPPYNAPYMEPPRRPGNQHSLRVSHRGRSNYLFLDLHIESLQPFQRCSSSAATPNIWRGRG